MTRQTTRRAADGARNKRKTVFGKIERLARARGRLTGRDVNAARPSNDRHQSIRVGACHRETHGKREKRNGLDANGPRTYLVSSFDVSKQNANCRTE